MQEMKYGPKIIQKLENGCSELWKLNIRLFVGHGNNSGWYVSQERWEFEKRLNMGKKMDEMKWNPRKLNIWWYVVGHGKCKMSKKKKGLNLGITMNETKIDKNNIWKSWNPKKQSKMSEKIRKARYSLCEKQMDEMRANKDDIQDS